MNMMTKSHPISFDYGPSKSVRRRWRKASRRVAIRIFIARLAEDITMLRRVLMGPRKPRYLSDCTPEQKSVFLALLAGGGGR